MSYEQNKRVARSLCTIITDEGHKLHSVDDGEARYMFVSLADTVERLTDVGDAKLYYERPDGTRGWFWLVWGNSPEEAIADYGSHETSDKIAAEHYRRWEGIATS